MKPVPWLRKKAQTFMARKLQKLNKKKPEVPAIVERKGKTKHLIYTPYFKQIVRKNPKIIELFLEARKTKKDKMSRGNITITMLKKGSYNLLWRVDIGKKSFYVKEKLIQIWKEETGPTEFLTARKLKPILTPNSEIAKYHLGWKNQNANFLVTDFYELPSVSSHLTKIPKKLYNEFLEFKRAAKNELKIWDINEHNAFYDSKRGKIIVFDSMPPVQS